MRKKTSWEFLFECNFLSKYESGVSDGRPARFKPDHYTNNSVYADYRSQFSLSDFLYVAGPIKFSLWLQLKEQKSSPGPWPRSRAACSSQSPRAVSQTQRFITKISHLSLSGSAIWVWIYLCGDQLHNTNYSPAVSQLCRDGVNTPAGVRLGHLSEQKHQRVQTSEWNQRLFMWFCTFSTCLNIWRLPVSQASTHTGQCWWAFVDPKINNAILPFSYCIQYRKHVKDCLLFCAMSVFPPEKPLKWKQSPQQNTWRQPRRHWKHVRTRLKELNSCWNLCGN